MRVRGIAAAVAGASIVVLSCGLDMNGLESTAGPDGGGGDDVMVTGGDVTVPGPEGSPAEGSPLEGAPPMDAAETGSVVDAPTETATTDSPAPPTCPPGVMCNGTCTANTDCRACSGATLLCAGTGPASSGTCASDCSGCASSPIECFACDGNRQNPIGTCEPNDPVGYCLSTNYIGAYRGQQGYHCGCNTAADCPGDTQVCIRVGTGPFACFTCGEAFTDMATCKNGTGNHMCNEMKAACN